jgi:hypothetical protein
MTTSPVVPAVSEETCIILQQGVTYPLDKTLTLKDFEDQLYKNYGTGKRIQLFVYVVLPRNLQVRDLEMTGRLQRTDTGVAYDGEIANGGRTATVSGQIYTEGGGCLTIVN